MSEIFGTSLNILWLNNYHSYERTQMKSKTYTKQLRQLITNDDLLAAFQKLQELLEGTPLLKKALIQNARFTNLTHQIHSGTITYDNANVTQNQIRASLLDIISEIENPKQYIPEIQKEIEQAVIKITHNKNVVTGNIQAGANVTIGDQTIHSESKTSKNLRLLLFLIVPLLAIGGAYFWYQNKIGKQPLNFKVLIENKTSIPELPEPNGSLTLFYGSQPHPKNNIHTEAIFENIPSNYEADNLRLQYNAEGFVPIDTTFPFTKSINLLVERNDDLAILQGYIYEEGTDPLVVIEGAKVGITCCSTLTNVEGKFYIKIPLEYQREQQQITISKNGYHQRNETNPIDKNIPIKTYLLKK